MSSKYKLSCFTLFCKYILFFSNNQGVLPKKQSKFNIIEIKQYTYCIIKANINIVILRI